MLERRRGRRALRRMTEHELRDIGLSPSAAYREALKYPWQS
ncbi:DUF1127 domain-containing protein [Arboricoccus pini]|nr:DUF1127 domain-containing protein [Arboricoccus pini]